MFEFVDKVVYINLDERQDRRATIEPILHKLFKPEQIIRFPAIRYSPGYVGCTKSHIAVLEMAKKHGWKNVLVLEDDAITSVPEKFEKGYAVLEELVKKDYDAIVLALLNPNINKTTYKTTRSLSTSAYLVNSHYYDKLLANFNEGLDGLLKTNTYSVYALDQWWWKLMQKDNWFGTLPSVFIQSNTWSTISGGMYTAQNHYQ